MFRLKCFVSKCTQLSLYKTLILPHIYYYTLAWATCSKTNSNSIHLLQQRAVRIICNAAYLDHTAHFFVTWTTYNLQQLLLSVRNIYVQLGQEESKSSNSKDGLPLLMISTAIILEIVKFVLITLNQSPCSMLWCKMGLCSGTQLPLILNNCLGKFWRNICYAGLNIN